MTIFRWIVGVLGGALAAWALLSFVIAIAFNNAVWHERARRSGRWLWLIALAWFNVEVWGSVAVVLVNWSR